MLYCAAPNSLFCLLKLFPPIFEGSAITFSFFSDLAVSLPIWCKRKLSPPNMEVDAEDMEIDNQGLVLALDILFEDEVVTHFTAQ